MTEDFFPAIWNVLHDGVIVAVDGVLPGDLRIRRRDRLFTKAHSRPRYFHSSSSKRLHSLCLLRSTKKSEFSTALNDIAAMGPEFVNASMKSGICEIDCVDGTLEVVAADGSIFLDSGRAVTLEELTAVASSYWKEWKEHWERVKIKKA